MKSSDRPENTRIELGDSEVANKVELVINTALSKAVPIWLKSVLVVILILQIVGIPTIIGTILLGHFGGNNCPQLYHEQPIEGGF